MSAEFGYSLYIPPVLAKNMVEFLDQLIPCKNKVES